MYVCTYICTYAYIHICIIYKCIIYLHICIYIHIYRYTSEIAGYCRVLQCFSVLRCQCAVVEGYRQHPQIQCCRVLQGVAVCCGVSVLLRRGVGNTHRFSVAGFCSVLQCVAVCCSVNVLLERGVGNTHRFSAAVCCSVLQSVAGVMQYECVVGEGCRQK